MRICINMLICENDMYVCVCVRESVCVYTYIYIFVCERERVCVCAYIHVDIYLHLLVERESVHTHICIESVRTHICICLFTPISPLLCQHHSGMLT